MTENPEAVFTSMSGIKRYALDEGKIVVIEGTGSIKHEDLDDWEQVFIEVIQSWEPHQPLYIMTDNSKPSQGFAPYIRVKAQHIYNALPLDAESYIAVVLPDNFVANILNLIVRALSGNRRAHIQVFRRVDIAQKWLETHFSQEKRS